MIHQLRCRDSNLDGSLHMLGAHNIIAFVPTTDAQRARDFYEQKLGLKFVADDAFALVFDANGIMVRVVKLKEFKPAQFTIMGWEVPDASAAVDGLKAKGVVFERYPWAQQDELGIWTAPGGAKVAWFKDPDGNVLSISQHTKG
jgi:catechol 2,3-dioxygenase-like lactoylglutathione lyase family enzyme